MSRSGESNGLDIHHWRLEGDPPAKGRATTDAEVMRSLWFSARTVQRQSQEDAGDFVCYLVVGTLLQSGAYGDPAYPRHTVNTHIGQYIGTVVYSYTADVARCPSFKYDC